MLVIQIDYWVKENHTCSLFHITFLIWGDGDRVIDVDLHLSLGKLTGLVFTFVRVIRLGLQTSWKHDISMTLFKYDINMTLIKYHINWIRHELMTNMTLYTYIISIQVVKMIKFIKTVISKWAKSKQFLSPNNRHCGWCWCAIISIQFKEKATKITKQKCYLISIICTVSLQSEYFQSFEFFFLFFKLIDSVTLFSV